MERWIAPLQEPGSAPTTAGIEAWQTTSGLRLPEDYRSFLLRHNGGHPYPLRFWHTALISDGFPNPSEHWLDPLNAWDRVLSWSAELDNRLPPGCLAIGADPGLIEIILSLRAEDHGAVYSWVRNWGAWGDEDNSHLCPQAPSFTAFMQSLDDDQGRSGHGYWASPSMWKNKRPLEM